MCGQKENDMDDRIEELLSKKADGELTGEEERELEAWTRVSKEREALSEEYLRVRRWLESGRNYAPDAEKGFWAWRRHRRRSRIVRFARYAAVFVGVAACGWVVWEYDRSGEAEKAEVVYAELPKADEGVFFEWADGRKTGLSGEMRDSVLAERDGVRVRVDGSNVLHYESESDEADTVTRYNRLVVPVGGDYRMVLGDGTKVWVNSASELEIPERFQAGERRVRLRGEAYFEVARDTARPFWVEAEGVSVQVLGTRFNVAAYGEDGRVETTLAEGKVAVSSGEGRRVVLKPGEQAVVEGARLDVRDVNVEDVISWIDGRFFFKQAPLEEVFEQAERWYGVSVRFEEESLKHIRFSGGVLKFNPVSDLLKMVEATGPVGFRVSGKEITVVKK